MESKPLLINKLKDAFFSLKISSGVEEVHCEPLYYLFQLPLEKAVFPDDLKMAKVTSVYKTGDNSDISNCRPISILPCFSKILKRLMHNHLYKY